LLFLTTCLICTNLTESIETTVTVYPLAAGLHRLQGVFVIDSLNNKEYHNDTLCEVLVSDFPDNDSDDDYN
jgi:hypothetical protein